MTEELKDQILEIKSLEAEALKESDPQKSRLMYEEVCRRLADFHIAIGKQIDSFSEKMEKPAPKPVPQRQPDNESENEIQNE